MADHCCETMAYWATYRCEQHADASECPDNIISFSNPRVGYGIRVHDGGTSSIAIAFCPWCGAKLSKASS